MYKVLASLVTFNSLTNHGEQLIKLSINALKKQSNIKIDIFAYDNGSSDNSAKFLESISGINLKKNNHNLGFAGASNQAVTEFLKSDYDYIVFINPDLVLEPNTILRMIEASIEYNADLVTPKIHNALDFDIIDACGMYLTTSLRHFDRGSQELNIGKYNKLSYVFGGTGACLLLTRKAVKELILPRNIHENDLYEIYPQLKEDARFQLFDEAFFAYREDADLAWRANLFGFKCLYVPSAIAFHSRVVKNQNRALLDAELNALSVKNRFLLQINNFSLSEWFILPSAMLRNILVIIAVFLIERTSINAFGQLFKLLPRAIENRRYILNRKINSITKWFFKYEEEVK